MKIYFIGQKGIPAILGGIEKHVEELSTRLADLGHEVFVYTRPHYSDSGLKKHRKVNLISLPGVYTKHLDTITHVFRACLDVARRDADIIHFHSIGPSSLIWLVRLLKPGVPIVATFHSKCYLHKKWNFFARAYLRLSEFLICLLPDVTISVSKSLARYAEEKYGAHTKYIPNGVGRPRAFSAGEIRKWDLKKGNYILSVSRLVSHKGIGCLIRAYNKIKTNKKLVIVGDGSFTDDYVKELKLLAKNNKNIIFTGAQSGRVLTELFSSAYLFVQPSESEGLSIALLEAMSYKLPVLVSDIPENLEASGNAGFSFKNKSVASLKNKLYYVLKNKRLAEKKAVAGHKRVKEFYNWDNIVREVVKVYEKFLTLKKESGFARPAKFARKFINFIF